MGETDFAIYDAWGRGIPITDSMEAVVVSGTATMAVMALLKDLFEEVLG